MIGPGNVAGSGRKYNNGVEIAMIVVQQHPHRVEVNVYGEFTLADYKEFEDMVNYKVRFHGPVDLYFDLRQMADFTLDVAWEEVVFARAHKSDFKRIAVITHSEWVAWSAWLSQIFVQAEMRLFDNEPEARAWLDEGEAERSADCSSTLVSCATLAAHLDDPAWQVIDVRHQLSDVTYGRRVYAESHLPGAIFLHLDDDLSGPKTGCNGRHPLPDLESMRQTFGRCGITPETQVVVYDDAGGMVAGRLWWMLRWLGHDRVALLDGGFGQWVKEGRPLDAVVPEVKPVEFIGAPREWTVGADEVLANIGNLERCVIDARGPDRFRGENETIDPVGGHIPGARNRFFGRNLGEDGLFRPADELRREFLELLDGLSPEQAILQCGSGVSACLNLLAMERAGLPGAKLYPGSWSEWCSDPARPVER